jgi:4-hydroxybenzoyl-CoA reductase subunit beta
MEAMSEFRLLRPTTLDGVLEARAAHPRSQLLGGGTDLDVNVRRGIVAPPVLIDVNGVAELRASQAGAQGLTLGASVTLAGLAAHPGVPEHFPSWRRRRAPSPGRPIAIWAPSAATQPRHALHLLQSEPLVAPGQQSLPQDHRRRRHVAPKSRGVCFATFSGDLAPPC